MNSITYLDDLVFEVGQVKDSIQIEQEPISIIQFVINDMKAHYYQNKSLILSRPEFREIDKKFGDQSVLQSILQQRQQLDQQSIMHFIQKIRKLMKQFVVYGYYYYHDLLNDFEQKVGQIKAQKGNDIFQYQFDLLKENINFAQNLFLAKNVHEYIYQGPVRLQVPEEDPQTIIISLLIYNLHLYISQFLTCDYRPSGGKIYINFSDDSEFLLEPLIWEQQTQQNYVQGQQYQQQQHNSQLQNQQSNPEQGQQQVQQQQFLIEQINNARQHTERLSIETNNHPSPRRLLQNRSSDSQRIPQLQEDIQVIQQEYVNLNQQNQDADQQLVQQQQPPQNNNNLPQSINKQNNNSITKLGNVLQKKQDQSFFKQPQFWNNKPRRTIFFDLTKQNEEQFNKLSSIFKGKSIFYSCDRLLLYIKEESQSQDEFMIKIDSLIKKQVKCYCNPKFDYQLRASQIKQLLQDKQQLKNIIGLENNIKIYPIIVDDLRHVLLQEFNIEIDKEIIGCL